MNRNEKFENSVFILIIVTLLTKAFGASRDLILSYCFGSTEVSDAYLLATTLPVTIFAFVNSGIGSSFIPAYTSIEKEDDAKRFTNNTICIFTLFTLAIVLLVLVFPQNVVELFAPGFSGITREYSIAFVKFSIIGAIFSINTNILACYLNIKNKIIIPTIRAIPMDIVVIVSILLSYKTGNLLYMMFGIPVSLCFEMLTMVPEFRKSGFNFKPVIDFKDTALKNMILWSVPVIVSSAIGEINSIIDRQFASSAISGSMSALTYSSRTINVIVTAFFGPFTALLFPKLSTDFAKGKISDAESKITDAFRKLLSFAIPVMIGAMICSEDIIATVFLRGSFGQEALNMTHVCFRLYAISLFSTAVVTITGKAYYAMKDMKTPFYISLFGIVFNYFANSYFYGLYGVHGLAFSSSLSTTISAVLQFALLRRKIKFEIKGIALTTGKSLLAALLMGGTILFVRSMLKTITDSYLVILGSSVLCGVAVYYTLMYLFKAKEAFEIFKIFGGKDEND